MAQKRKTPAKRKPATKDRKVDKPVFWPQAVAVVLVLLGLLLALGAFKTGGILPIDLFKAMSWLFGWAAYVLPFALIYLGAYLFMQEEHELPVAKQTGLVLLMLFLSSFTYVSFATKSGGLYSGGHGGKLGEGLGSVVLNFLDQLPAAIIFLAFALLAVLFMLNISPRKLLSLAKLFKKAPAEGDQDLAALKARAENSNFKLNEGVPVVHHSGDNPAKMASLKNTAQRLSADEDHQALVTTSDPNWQFPSIDLLDQKQDKADAGDVNRNAQIIHDTFENFNIGVEMEGANIGPRVTQYTLKPPTGVKLTKITALENNLALDLAAPTIRMEAPIPGKRAVGIEVPNIKPATVRISSILLSKEWQSSGGQLSFSVGKDIAGSPIVSDLAKLPHLLVAGQTGAGKSVMINSILTSLLYRNSPADLKLILIDPKQVELKPYDEIPHLLAPVITEPEKCISALKWSVAEMERRYRELADAGRRNIAEYNDLKKEAGMPYIVIVIDELADIMMMAARDVEALVVRIAQKARAVGIHLVLATQRPSVDVITGLIKANIPARMAFTTASQVDSRTILDQIGAEKLLGSGDMLLTTADMPKPRRVQGAYISNNETTKVSDFIRMQRPPQYNDEVVSQPVQIGSGRGGLSTDYGQDVDDEMWRDAVKVVIDNRKASTSLLQRRLRIGYGRAARLIETMEEQGIVGPADGSRPREVLVSSTEDIMGAAQTDNAEVALETDSEEVY